jgi:hypothetical protein
MEDENTTSIVMETPLPLYLMDMADTIRAVSVDIFLRRIIWHANLYQAALPKKAARLHLFDDGVVVASF